MPLVRSGFSTSDISEMTEAEINDWRSAIEAYDLTSELRDINTVYMGTVPKDRGGVGALNKHMDRIVWRRKIALNLHKVVDPKKVERSWARLNGKATRHSPEAG